MKIADRVALTAFLLACLPIAPSAQELGAVKGYAHLPVLIYDEDDHITGDMITKANAPPPSEIAIYGWQPHSKMLLVRLHPSDTGTVFIAFNDVMMVDQALWEDRMRATQDIVCLPPPRMHIVSQPVDTTATTTKGFRNPC
jgi:hypothetical protein